MDNQPVEVQEAIAAPTTLANGEVVLVDTDGSAEAMAEAQAHTSEENVSGNEEAIVVGEVSVDVDAPEVA